MAYSRPRIAAALANASCRLGYQCLTTEQRKAVIHFVSGKDMLISLPTGSGKSLCYGLLPFVFDFCNSVWKHLRIIA